MWWHFVFSWTHLSTHLMLSEGASVFFSGKTDIREQTKNVKKTSVNIDLSVTLLFISVDLHLTIYKCITLKVV